VVFEPNSTYSVDIDHSGADQLLVDGDVTINGGTVRVASEGTIVGDHDYEIIQGTSVTGEFTFLNTALLSFSASDSNLVYDPNSVWLHIAAANFNDPNFAGNYNQQQVGGALQGIANGGGNGITNALQDINDVVSLRRSYDQLNGHRRPSLGPLTSAGTSRFLGTVTGRLQGSQGVTDMFSNSSLFAMAGPDTSTGEGRMYDVNPRGRSFGVGRGSRTLPNSEWGLWGRAYGLYADREAGDEMQGYNCTVYGGSVGLDYQFTDTWLGGLVVGLSRGDVDYSGSRDNSDFQTKHIGLYGSAVWDDWYLNSVATYGMLEYDTERFVDLLGERLTATFNGNEAAGYLEVGVTCHLSPELRLQPLASLQYTHLRIDSYTETGGTAALAFEEQTYESVKGSLGARLTQTLVATAGDFRADVQVRGRWVHEFGDNEADVDASFANSPTFGFNLRDDEVSRDSAILGAGISADLNAMTRVAVDYDTRLNSDESVQVISASLQYRW